MRYQRFISYLYCYENGEKVENTGYVKVEQKGGMIRISLRSKIRESDEQMYHIYLVMQPTEANGGNHGLLLAKQPPQRGLLTYQYVAGIEDGFGANLTMDDFVGVLIRGQQAIYMTIWQDIDIMPEQIMCVENIDAIQNEMPESITVDAVTKMSEGEEGIREPEHYEADNNHVIQENVKQENMKQDKMWQETPVSEKPEPQNGKGEIEGGGAEYLFKNRNSLPAVEGSTLLDCIRIEPKDLGLLDMRNWRYGSNSFLSHGYYRYRYLLLGKIKFQDDSEKIMLGVPGIYTNKEKHLANMFGFEQFVTTKRTDRKLGQFGYWLVELV